MVYVPRPCVIDLRSVAYRSISLCGTLASMTVFGPSGVMPLMCARRVFRSPMMSPANSLGTVTSTFMTGSNNTGLACANAALKPSEPALLERFPNALLHSGNELPGYDAADDLIGELESRAAR